MSLELAEEKTTALPAGQAPQTKNFHPALAHGLDPALDFNGFVVGKANRLAHEAAFQVAKCLGGLYNPLCIYGGVGLGKTHLLQAIGNAVRREKAEVAYFHAERFVTEMVRACQNKTMEEFKRFLRSKDLLLMDDVQFLGGKKRSQEEFFHTFNAMVESGHQVIIACSAPPHALAQMEERLASRLGWGLTVAVSPPEMELRAAILKKKASLMGMSIPEEACVFIASAFRHNVRELEGALKRVNALAGFHQKPVSLPLVKEALKDLIGTPKDIGLDDILQLVAERYQVLAEELLGKSRAKSVSYPRQMAMALAKELTDLSLPEIGAFFGGRSHTTVLYACRQVQTLKARDEQAARDWQSLMEKMGGSSGVPG